MRRAVPSATLQISVVALVHSRLDYGNAVLVINTQHLQMRQLQSVVNAAVAGGTAHLPSEYLRTYDHVITDALLALYYILRES